MPARARLISYGIPLAAIAAAIVSGIAVTSNRPSSPVVEPLRLPPQQPRGGGGAGFIGASGVIEAASENIAIGTNVGGVVARGFVVVGQDVNAGQPLFQIDPRDLVADIRVRAAEAVSARRQVAVAVAAVREARADLADRSAQAARVAAVDLPGAVSGEEVSQRRFAAEAARARLDRATADVARARADAARADAVLAQSRTALDRLLVRAPIAGRVLRLNVRPGEYATAGALATPLLVLGETRPLHVRVDVDEADIPRLERGGAAAIALRGAAAARIVARYVRIEPLVVPKTQLSGAGTERVDTRVLQAIYAFDPGDRPVFPGQQVDVFLPAKTAQGRAR